MIRFFQIAVFSCLGLLLTGCKAPEESEPIWEQVKIGDIAPSHSGKQPDSQLLKTINFNVYIFEIFGDLNDYILLLFNRTHNL